MGYIFRPGITACHPGAKLILLDIVGDRYVALGDAATAACLRLIEGRPLTAAASAAIDGLVARDILRATTGAARPQLCPPATPVLCCASTGCAPARASVTATALLRHAIAVIEIRARRLATILAGLARAKRRMAPGDRVDPARIAAAFARADRIMTACDRCLPRSIAITRTMIASGIRPDMILGVKLRPFEAHCWVQHGDCLVGDDPATIAPFTPILIL